MIKLFCRYQSCRSIGGMAALLLCFLLVSGCGKEPQKEGTSRAPVGSLRFIAETTGIPFTWTTARVVQFSGKEIGMFDSEWVAKVQISAEDIPSIRDFLEQRNSIPESSLEGTALRESTEWWKPGDIVIKKWYRFGNGDVYVIVSKDGDDAFLYIDAYWG